MEPSTNHEPFYRLLQKEERQHRQLRRALEKSAFNATCLSATAPLDEDERRLLAEFLEKERASGGF